MLKHSAQIGALALFAVVVVVLGYILWRALFPTYHPNDDDSGANKQYAQQQSSSENAEIGPQKSGADESIATYTLALAIFTALLVLISAFQIAFLIRADDTATKTAQAAQKSAEAAKDSASVAEKALVDVERPFLFVYVTEPGILPVGDEQHFPFVEFTIENVGRQPAIIDFAHAEILLPDPSTPQLPIPGAPEIGLNSCTMVLTPQPLPTGRYLSWKCQYKSIITAEQVARIKGIGPIGQNVFFRGEIRYHDPLGTRREAWFCMIFREPTEGSPRGYFVYTDRTSNYDKKV